MYAKLWSQRMIRFSNTGLDNSSALLLSGNTLFVSSYVSSVSGTVGEYNATTGAAINASLIIRYPCLDLTQLAAYHQADDVIRIGFRGADLAHF
jgi:hypothetical protein